MSKFGPSFIAASTGQLKRRGLRGDTVAVVLTADVVGLIGADGGDQPIPFARISGLRAGTIYGKLSRRPELRLYLQGEAQPLRLFPQRDLADAAAASRSYPQFVREVAARLASGGGFARIETGSGKVWAAISTVLVSLPAIGMVGVFASTVLLTLPHAERWIARSFTAIVAVAAIWLAAWWWREHWPVEFAGSPIWTARYH